MVTMADVNDCEAQYSTVTVDSNGVNDKYAYAPEGTDFNAMPPKSNRMEQSESTESVDFVVPDTNGAQLYDADAAAYQPNDGGRHTNYAEQAWPPASYVGMAQEGIHYNSDVSHESHMGYVPPSFDMTAGMVPGYAGLVPDGTMPPADAAHMHAKMLDVNQHDLMQTHPIQPVKLDPPNLPAEPPRRLMSKGRKNKDEANELVRRAKLLPKVMGVRYDANHQYWVATWYQNRKRMDRYFSVGRFGFEEARMLAIDCRKTAGKSLQGKSYDRPQYQSKDSTSKSRSSYSSNEQHGSMSYGDGENAADKSTEYYGGTESSKKTKDFNRLNVSKVALNYILSDLCNNCLPSILENNHMPGELYIHCYNKISDHLQMIITANQSEEIEKYLHLFQLCIQNRVLPSALQVQEQRAMITTLCQM